MAKNKKVLTKLTQIDTNSAVPGFSKTQNNLRSILLEKMNEFRNYPHESHQVGLITAEALIDEIMVACSNLIVAIRDEYPDAAATYQKSVDNYVMNTKPGFEKIYKDIFEGEQN